MLPAASRRLDVHDANQAARLAAVGATISRDGAEVAIGPASWQAGDAPCAVVNLGPTPSRHEGGSRHVKAARRIAVAGSVRVTAWRTRRRLRRLGYERVATLPWDLGQPVPLSGTRRPGRSVELFPRRAVVVARRRDDTLLLDQVVADAERGAGRPVALGTTLARTGLLVAVDDDTVLRVAVGPAAVRVAEEARTLGLLRELHPPAGIADLLPEVLAAGTTGLATWLLESRARGTPPRTPLTAPFLDDCVTFLAALHQVGDGATGATPEADAEVVAEVCDAELAPVVRRLAARAGAVVGGLPRGFGHGDFWHANLLADGSRLTGVVDWDSAGQGRLPYLDLMHLALNARRPRGFDHWGPAIVDHLLPWARAGGDALAARYGDAIGVPADARTMEALVVAYWLDFVAYQLRTYAQRRHQPVWMRANVGAVARALDEA